MPSLVNITDWQCLSAHFKILYPAWCSIPMKIIIIWRSYKSALFSHKAASLCLAYGVGKPGFDQFLSSLPADFNVVAEGGYYAVHQRYRKFHD